MGGRKGVWKGEQGAELHQNPQSPTGHRVFPEAAYILRSSPAFQTWFAKFLGHSFQGPFFPRPQGQSKAAELE